MEMRKRDRGSTLCFHPGPSRKGIMTAGSGFGAGREWGGGGNFGKESHSLLVILQNSNKISLNFCIRWKTMQ